jgi:ribosomal protein S18 acetylase RimI-like enzyme
MEQIGTEGNQSQPDYDNEPVSVAHVAPERMSDRTWNLYLMAIHPNHQKQGRGAELLRYVEQMLAKCGERMLLVETTGADDFQYVRAFYRNRGYEEEARIRDFYTDGFDKIVFRKLLGSVAA